MRTPWRLGASSFTRVPALGSILGGLALEETSLTSVEVLDRPAAWLRLRLQESGGRESWRLALEDISLASVEALDRPAACSASTCSTRSMATAMAR